VSSFTLSLFDFRRELPLLIREEAWWPSLFHRPLIAGHLYHAQYNM